MSKDQPDVDYTEFADSDAESAINISRGSSYQTMPQRFEPLLKKGSRMMYVLCCVRGWRNGIVLKPGGRIG